jgi:pilus assembly protein CpaC
VGGLFVLAAAMLAPSPLAGQQQVPPSQPAPTVLPRPRLLPAPGCVAPPVCPGEAAGTDSAPKPTPKVLEKFAEFVERTIDPENVLDLVVGLPRVLVFKTPPSRVQMGEEEGGVAAYKLLSETELSVTGKKPGRTVLNLWFADPKDKVRPRVLSYLVRVRADPEASQRALQEKERKQQAEAQWLRRYYKGLEASINSTFLDSQVCLAVVGESLVVSGQARDAIEAAQILRLLQPRQAAGGTGPGGALLLTEQGLDRSRSLLLPLPVGDDSEPQQNEGKPPAASKPPEAPAVEPPGAAVPSRVPRLAVVNQLRIPGEQQVALKVTVAEINRTAARSIGVNWSIANNQGLIVFSNTTGNLSGTAVTSTTATSTGTASAISSLANINALLDAGKIGLAINALRTLNVARSLAEPTLVTLNGQTARFAAGGEFPVPVVTGFTAAGLQGVSFIPFGVQLSFTPVVTDRDRIRLQVTADVSVRDPQTGAVVNGTAVPGLNTRNFATVVELREGETLAVAGLVQNNFGSDGTRVPLLGDLPVVGRLAAFDRTSTGEQELVVLVTPELAHPVDAHEGPPLPGADSFEPSDVEFYLLGRLESHRPYDHRSPSRTSFLRMLRRGDSYIIGPQGHCDGDR